MHWARRDDLAVQIDGCRPLPAGVQLHLAGAGGGDVGQLQVRARGLAGEKLEDLRPRALLPQAQADTSFTKQSDEGV